MKTMLVVQVTSLAEFSARLHVRQGGSGDAAAAAAAPQRSNATAEGLHVRCFERLTMCRVVKRKVSTWELSRGR